MKAQDKRARDQELIDVMITAAIVLLIGAIRHGEAIDNFINNLLTR